MSSNLMDTEKGGEQTQYEAEHTHVDPTKKSGGQLGEPSTVEGTDPSSEASKLAERGARTAENIRYGQTISEGGMGGQTTGLGDATEAGYGRVQDAGGDGGDGVQERRAQGLGGDEDMDRSVGG